MLRAAGTPEAVAAAGALVRPGAAPVASSVGSSTGNSVFAGPALTNALSISLEPGTQIPQAGLEALVKVASGTAEGPLWPFALPQLMSGATYRIARDDEFPEGVDGQYDAKTGEVHIRASVVRDVMDAAQVLATYRRQRESGAQPDPRFTEQVRDDARHTVGTALAFLVHEGVHAQQQHDHGEAITNAATAGDVERHIRQYELPAIRVQEELQRFLNEAPEHGSWLTLDAAGQPVSDDVAMANIMRTHSDAIAASLAGTGAPGFRFPGFRFPGFRFPGSIND